MAGPDSLPQNDTAIMLRGDAAFGPWLEQLEQVGPPVSPVVMPSAIDGGNILDFLDIPVEERPAVLAASDWIAADPALTWVLDRSVVFLCNSIDQVGWMDVFPSLPSTLGERARYFYPWLYAAILPDTLAASRSLGIPDEIVRATFADVGRHFLKHRARHGTGGMAGQDWLTLHARGVIFQLGRLQFERTHLGGRTSAGIRAAGHDAVKGELCIAVHIPDFMGPFPPEACDESFALAEAFFARHFPEETYRYAVCHSWLLDEQLREYLPPDANIIAFQRRFQPAYTPDADDRITLLFVFRNPDRRLEDFPQRTTLERAVVYHLQQGRHWHGGAGWLPFARPTGKDNTP
ncbi:MAG TPA: acyltransferase domain-containing protein [Thermomicrobiales bacterium]|nr:acyltransferase domain-containing protein [Thermomicrobiales bacterium]